MKIETWPIDRPKPYPKNPRRNEKAVAKVAASLREFGFRQPIVVDSEGVIIAGHTRLLAARSLGLREVPVVIADDLSPAQVRAYRLADNRSGQEAEWDDDLLAGELAALDLDGFDLALTAFDADELAALLRPPTGTLEDAALDEIPPLPDVITTQLGDLILLGRHRLLCGDAGDLALVAKLLDGQRADLVLTDPPYAIYGSSTGVASDIMDDKMVRPFFRDVLRACAAVLKTFGHAYISCDWRSWASWWEVAKGSGIVPKNMIVWDKGSGIGTNYTNAHELLLFASYLPTREKMTERLSGMRLVAGSTNVWRVNRVPPAGGENGRVHNAQKPVELFAKAIEISTDKGERVVDFFAGSGTTLIAAEQLDRIAYLMEIDPGYCDVIVARWETATGQKATRPAQ